MKKLYYSILVLGFALSSCNDWLDVKPQLQKEEEEMFEKEKGFKDALIACYIKMNSANLYGKRLTMTDVEYLAQHWTTNSTNGDYLNEMKLKEFDYETTHAQSFINAAYAGLYNIIVQANVVLENVKENTAVFSSDSLRAVLEAEALAIRAFCHLDILRLFGQLPQQATQKVSLPYNEKVSHEAVPYYDFEAYVQHIVNDLNEAERLLAAYDPILKFTFEELDLQTNPKLELEDSFFAYRRFRFNYYAVKAIQARLYTYLGQQQAAYAAAMTVINAVDRTRNKALTLAGAADFNAKSYALPSECILALSNFEIGKITGSSSNSEIDRLFHSTYGLYMTESQLRNDLFAGQSMAINNRAINLWNTTSADSQGNIKPILRKYEQPTNNPSANTLATQKQVVPLIRLSEMYLIAIESSTDLTEINALYKTYMDARNVIATTFVATNDVLSEVIREYRREFFAEGQMFFTYKRLNVTNMLWKTDRTVTEKDYIVPLPKSEITSSN